MIITAENYRSPESELEYMGSTQFKSFLDCESRALAMVRGEWEEEKSVSLLVGSYVDAHFSNELSLFKAQNPEIFTKQGELKADFKQANEIIQRIERDEFMMWALSGKKQVIKTGNIDGVPFKIKIDSYLDDQEFIVDLKIVKDFLWVWSDGKGRVPFVDAWGYDIQLAIYQEIERQNRGSAYVWPALIAAATKEKSGANISVMSIPQDILDRALDSVFENVHRVQDIKQGRETPRRCEVCDYCKATKVLSKIVDYREVR